MVRTGRRCGRHLVAHSPSPVGGRQLAEIPTSFGGAKREVPLGFCLEKAIKVAKLRHIAITVPDPEVSARFYEVVFELAIVGRTDSELASGVYLSDGTICLALLCYKTDEAAGKDRGQGYVGAHHIGFWCECTARSRA